MEETTLIVGLSVAFAAAFFGLALALGKIAANKAIEDCKEENKCKGYEPDNNKNK